MKTVTNLIKKEVSLNNANLTKTKAFTLSNIQMKFFNTVVPTSQGQVDPNLKVEVKPIDKWVDLQNLKPSEIPLLELRQEIEKTLKYAKTDKAINHSWETPYKHGELIDINFRLAVDIDSILMFIKAYKGYIDSAVIFKKFYDLSLIKDYNRETFTVYLPVLKEYMGRFDRHSITEIYYAAMGAAKLHIADKEFWTIVETKLVNDKLYRYLSLEQAANLAYQLNASDRASVFLLKLLEVEFVKNRKALSMQKKLLNLVKQTYVDTGKASSVLIEALKDPSIEITTKNKLT